MIRDHELRLIAIQRVADYVLAYCVCGWVDKGPLPITDGAGITKAYRLHLEDSE